jgi:Zn-dependent peptidase ImmA (M78 family)/DNA-binding XRE family transcriptional regulator
MKELFFNPNRLKLARARRALTIKALAEAVGMTPRIFSSYENGSSVPPFSTLQKIAQVLKFPEDFFSGDDIEELDPECVSFRSMKRMKATQRDAALGAARIAIILNDWLEENFSLPPTNLCDLREIADPETAARSLREQWNLGERSISNMIHLLEAKGVKVFSLEEVNQEVDAFSFWKNGKAFIFLNNQKSPERRRFDAAHELAHLVLHKHGTQVSELKEIEASNTEFDEIQDEDKRAIEREADRFASAFLMPAGSVQANAPRFPNIENLILLKKLWSVSLASLVRRLKDLGLITEWHYRSLTIEMSRRGMLKKEPESIEAEVSQILSKIFRSLRQEGIGKAEIANQLKIPSEEIDLLAFKLAFVGSTVESSMKPSCDRTTIHQNKPTLRLVK